MSEEESTKEEQELWGAHKFQKVHYNKVCAHCGYGPNDIMHKEFVNAQGS